MDWFLLPIHLFSDVECRYLGYCSQRGEMVSTDIEAIKLAWIPTCCQQCAGGLVFLLGLETLSSEELTTSQAAVTFKMFPLLDHSSVGGHISSERLNKQFMIRMLYAMDPFLWIPSYNSA